MIRKQSGTVFKDVQTLIESGAVGWPSDAEVLGRFVDPLLTRLVTISTLTMVVLATTVAALPAPE